MTEPRPIPIVMPQMGESLAEGTVVRWLKAVGDPVSTDEPLFEISTDKVDTDVPSPTEGVLHEILVPAGATVTVDTIVATIVGAGSTVDTPPVPDAEAPPAEQSGGHFKASRPSQLVSFRDREHRRAPQAGVEPRGPEPTHTPPAAIAPDNRSYSPAVLEAVRAAGVPLDVLTTLPGSGRGGRLTKRDVERYLQSGSHSLALGPRAAVAESPPPEYLYRPGPGDERVPMSPVRRTIAHHMSWSTRISPHATAFAECDMSTCSSLLAERRERFANEVGAPLTYTVLVSKAAVGVLKDFPPLNASVLDDSLVIKPSIHLGVAVALPDTDDLIVPVVRDADGLSLAGLARAIADLAGRARARRLKPEEVRGGTFTLTNPGMFGGLGGTPIISQPQVAILGLGAITKRPVVVDDAIAIRPIMLLSLTFDHRAADGMMAFRYLDSLRRRVEAGPGEGEW